MALVDAMKAELAAYRYAVEVVEVEGVFLARASRGGKTWEERGETEEKALARLMEALAWDLED